MSEEAPAETSTTAPAEPAIPWALATVDDVLACDVDAQIPCDAAADCDSLSEVFLPAAEQAGVNLAAARVFRMLGSLLSMMLEANNPAAPFRPWAVLTDGRRSASLEDFRACLKALVAVATRSQHPTIISRAADVAWMLERRRHDMGLAALAAYSRLLDEVAAGQHRFKHEVDQEGGPTGISVLRRCVVIARSRSFGNQAPDIAPLVQRIEGARKRALDSGEVGRHLALAALALDYELQEPETLALDLEASIAGLDPAINGHLIVGALKAATRAYRQAGKSHLAHAAQQQISDVYVAMSEKFSGSAMIASRHLANAISALAGVPHARDRRRELRHRLVDSQSGIIDEMGSFSEPIDIDELRSETARIVEGRSFYDTLFFFAVMQSPPDPNKVRDEAIEQVQAHPLRSLFGATHHDREGKVRYVSAGVGNIGDINEANLEAQIAQHGSIRRTITVGQLDVVRQYMAQSFYITPDVLMPLLSASPFVPEGQETTFAHGLSSFLRGDAITALYVLTPLVEAGVRSCLKSAGHEVSTFNDARQTQEDKSLSKLYDEHHADIAAVFGDALAFDIEQVFLHRAGPSLRHGVAHGSLYDGTAYSPDAFYACWLVLHLSLVPLYKHRGALGLPGLASPRRGTDDG